jgi:outer membrane lipoprotein-sorting protein
MKFICTTAATFALILSGSVLNAQSPSPKQLTDLLQQLDTAATRFTNAQANVSYDNYTRVIRADSLETGSLYIEKSGKGQQMGAVFFESGPDNKPTKSPSKILSYDGGTLQIFAPGVNQDDVFKAGANQAKYESFLTLGFGGSGSDLAKAWTITYDRNEPLSDGTKQVNTAKLILVSKDPGVRDMFTRVTIWVDPQRGISLKQIFDEPNGDSRTAIYSNIRLNGHIDKKPYEISKKAQRIPH